MRRAVIPLVLANGWDQLQVAEVLEQAAVEQDWFASHFPDLPACCIEIFRANIAEFDRFFFAAADAESEWRPRLRAATYAGAHYVHRRPLEIRFNMVALAEGGELAQAYRDRYVTRVVALIDEGRLELAEPDSIEPGVAEAVFGAFRTMLVKPLVDGSGDSPSELVPELMYLAVRSYLGHQAALEELEIAPPAEPSRRPARERA